MSASPSSSLLDRLVPFHVELDGDLRVRRVGPGLRAALDGPAGGRPLLDLLSVVEPALACPADLVKTTGARLLCRLRERPLTLRAQLLDAEGGFVLAATPWLDREEDLAAAGIDAGLAAPHEGWADGLARERVLDQQRVHLQALVTQLEDREARLGAVVDAAIDAILGIDDACKIERVNPAAVRLFGYPAEELIGRDFWVLMPSPEDDRDVEFLEILAISGIRGEFTAVGKGGRAFAVELSASKLVLQGRTRFTAIVRDISERKKLEQLQSEFVSTVSHEMRTPLTAIRGALGLVAGGVTGELSPEAEECIQIALSNGDRLIRIINDILDLEKIQSGQMEFRMELLELRAVVMAALEANTAVAASQDIALRLVGDPADGEVIGDEQRLFQVMTNLLSNAAKFSPPKATVDVSVERLGDVMRVSVRDHGKGVPTEFHDRIFQRFAQADASSTRAKGGTGLGLSISKTIVEHMHGRIGFMPAADGGTIFYFELPRVRRPGA